MRLLTGLRKLAQRYSGYDFHKYQPEAQVDCWDDIAEIIGKSSNVSAFDVGANRGQTINELKQILPGVSIHAFEPSPSTFVELSHAVAGYEGVILNNCGMGSQNSEMELLEHCNPVMTSFLELGPQGYGETVNRVKVPITTVDDYCAERSIEHVHLLKIDTQGFDFEVIKGAERMLTQGHRIDLVLTEITIEQQYERLPRFDEIYGHMAERGYRLTGVSGQQRTGRILVNADVMFASPSIVQQQREIHWAQHGYRWAPQDIAGRN